MASSAAALHAATTAAENHSVQWHVAGFTCPTCAVGLETLLRRKPGVLQVQASYPEGRVRIQFNLAKITERELRDAVTEMGFKVEPLA